MGVNDAPGSLSKRFKARLPVRLRRKYWHYRTELSAHCHSSDLATLALLYRTDKWGSHFYAQHYQRYFEPFRRRPLKILEIGVGGYSAAGIGGSSLRMWKRFFPKSHIVGIDLYDKTAMSEHRIDVLQCDQTDAEKIAGISGRYGPFDIIIDDGSHINEHVISTFQTLFPLLKNPGIYAVEDLQTAYWPSWGGIRGRSSMDFLKSLADGLNYVENPVEEERTLFDACITEIAFFHNLCILRKGNNDEPANFPELVQKERDAMQLHL